MSGGPAAIRGYLVQTLVALLEALDADKDWISVTLEPRHVSEKIDILWQYRDSTKAVQVKSSENQISVPDARGWAEEFRVAHADADEFELVLVGPCSEGVVKLGNVGSVLVPSPKNLDLSAFLEQAAHRLDRFLESEGLPRGNARQREGLAHALASRLETMATGGTPLARKAVAQQLKEWIASVSSLTTQPPGSQGWSNGLTVERPGLIRCVLDWACPKLHSWLTRTGTLRVPREMDELADYLRELHSEMSERLSHPYVDLRAKLVPGQPMDDLPGHDPFVRPVSQRIREILGLSQGGDSATAQIVAIDRKSRMVRNLVKVLHRAQEPLVLLGDPGTGKTMTLMEVAKSLLERERDRVFPVVTLYVRLGEFHVEGPVGTQDVLEYVKRQVPAPIAARIEALDHAGRLVILFDGMDEMSRDRYSEHTDALSKFAGKERGRTKTLFSCRITDFSPMFKHHRLVLLPFGRSQIREYLHRYRLPFPLVIDAVRWSARRLAKELAHARLPVEATNPLVLWLLCYYLVDKKAWPPSRAALLEFYVEQNYLRKSKEMQAEGMRFPAVKEALAGWGRLAYEITIQNRGAAISVALFGTITEMSANDLEELIAVGKRCGVLVESHDRYRERLVRFEHHRFQEYFAALYICNARPAVDWASKFDSPRWQETLVNIVLIRGDPETAMCDLAQSLVELIMELRGAAAVSLWEQRHAALAKEKEGKRPASKPMKYPRKGAHEEMREAVPLPMEAETILGDRLQLASRIVRHVGSGTSSAGDRLMRPVMRGLALLSQYGNPISHVKILEVCQNVPGINLIGVLKRPLRSKVDWVRNQAITVIAESAGGARATGTDYATELAYDLVTGVFPNHVQTYAKAALAGRSKGLRKSFLLAVACYLAALVFSLGSAVGLYRAGLWCLRALDRPVAVAKPAKDDRSEPTAMERLGDWIVAPWPALLGKEMAPGKASDQTTFHGDYVARYLEHRVSCLLFVVCLLGTACAVLRLHPAATWGSIVAVPFAYVLVGTFVLLGWRGYVEEMKQMFSPSMFSTFAFGFAAAGVGSLTTWSLTAVYLGLTRSARSPGHTAASVLGVTWVGRTARKRRQILNTVLVQTREFLLVIPGLAVVFAGILLGLPALAYLGLWASRVSGLPFLPIWNDVIIISPLLVWVGIRWIWPWLAAKWRTAFLLVHALVIAGVASVALLGTWRGILWLLERWLGESLPLYIGRAVAATIITIIAVVALVPVSIFVAGLLHLLRRRPHPPGSFTREQWKEGMERGDVDWQRDLLTRSNHQSVGLTPGQFLGLLREVQQTVKEEPALSAYWDRRHQLERVLKQERQG